MARLLGGSSLAAFVVTRYLMARLLGGSSSPASGWCPHAAFVVTRYLMARLLGGSSHAAFVVTRP
ncbi:hypothetical protein EUA04_23885 [Mycolicibacterium obuense]|uniref:Uncharacterized protein n=1 Tax=Mycolicibacterium obuense TaxID=1807 RepID=A0A4R5X1F0_9MYCO|nr:hypothetical protein [Mycolicibacterium obuense]TDL04239.1 hypothetical protein EUA04_23885 [Mycolicibacterium obuense]